ncbi:MAG TPA: hypothetical protein VI612_01640, partial [Candidatus Nanoarchaeia archaeon]|nr:hypothetical protein [Candidatus Nanoarchaeia archaeon]
MLKKLLKEPGFLILVLVILSGLWLQLMYEQYPHCINLCDPSHYLSILMNAYEGNPPYIDPVLKGVYAVYPWTGMYLLAKTAKILGINPVKAFVFSGWLMISSALLLTYFAAKKFGISKTALTLLALMEAILMINAGAKGIFGVFHQSGTHFLAFSLLAFSIATYIHKRKTGLILLICSIILVSQLHFINTIYALAVIPTFFIINYYITKNKQNLCDILITTCFGIASLLPTIWTWKLNSFQIKNYYISLQGNIILAKDIIPSLFSNWYTSLFSILLIIAVLQYLFYFRKKLFWSKENLPDLAIFSFCMVAIALSFNNLVLRPVLGFDIVPSRFFTFFTFSIPFIVAKSFERFKTLRKIDKIDWRLIFIVIEIFLFIQIIFVWANSYDVQNGLGTDIWRYSESNMGGFAEFVKQKTAPNDVIASTYALGSFINTLTGRKLV